MGVRRLPLVLWPLAILVSTFFPYFILGGLSIPTPTWFFWVAYFASSWLIHRGLQIALAPIGNRLNLSLPVIDRISLTLAAAGVVVMFTRWHYIGSSASSMYYFFIDLVRHWNESSLLSPGFPTNDPVHSFTQVLTYHPGLGSILLLLGVGLPSAEMPLAWGLLIGFFNAGFLVSLSGISNLLTGRIWAGFLAFFGCFSLDLGFINWTGLLFQISSHDTTLLYTGALLVWIWSAGVYAGHSISLAGLTLAVAATGVATRPYVAAVAFAALLEPLISKLLHKGIWPFKQFFSLHNKTLYRPILAGFVLATIIGLWNLVLIFKYGSPFVYQHQVVYARLNQANGAPTGRWSVFVDQVLTLFVTPFLDAFHSLANLDAASPPLLRFGVLSSKVTLVILGVLVCIFLRWKWARPMAIPRRRWLGFAMVAASGCYLANTPHWKLYVPFVGPALAALAAAWWLALPRWTGIFLDLTTLAASLALAVSALRPFGLEKYFALMHPSSAEQRVADDLFRKDAGRLITEKPGTVLMIRSEPGADVVNRVSGQYFWTQRHFWNDGELIMDRERWNPEKVAAVHLSEKIRWIYQPFSDWSLDHYSGREVLAKLKALLESSPAIYVPRLIHTGPYKGTLYEIRLPGE